LDLVRARDSGVEPELLEDFCDDGRAGDLDVFSDEHINGGSPKAF